jgi:hypothetical protein
VPYKILYKPRTPPRGRPWKIYNLDKKKIVGSSVTKKMAEASIRARYLGEHRRE